MRGIEIHWFWRLLFWLFVGGTALFGIGMGISSFSEPAYLPGSAFLLLPLCITMFWSAIGALRGGDKVSIGIALKLIVGISIIVLVILTFQESIQWNKAEEPFIAMAKDACLGKANPNAAAYKPDLSFHPTIFLNEKGEDTGMAMDSYFLDWQPGTPQELQLAACIEEKQIGLQTCHYTGGGVWNRSQNMVHIRLMAISTGVVVSEKDLSGPVPGSCPETIHNSGGDSDGGAVSNNDINAWLAQFVNKD